MHRAPINSCMQMYDVSHTMHQSCQNVICTAFVNPHTGQKLPKMLHMCLNQMLCDMFTARACNINDLFQSSNMPKHVETAKKLMSNMS